MSFRAFHVAAEDHFATEWIALKGGTVKSPGVPVRWPNVPWTMPEEPFVAWFIREPPFGRQVSLGFSPLHRFVGEFVVQVFDKEDASALGTLGLSDDVAGIYRGANGRGLQLDVGNGGLVTFGSPGVSYIGVDGGWYQTNVTVPYQRDINY